MGVISTGQPVPLFLHAAIDGLQYIAICIIGMQGCEYVEVLVSEGTSENDVADMIGNAFEVILGEDDFNIKVSWGENIKIEAKDDTPAFVLEIASSSVQGLSIEIQE